MQYQALARQWRPIRFDQIVGQDHIVKILSNALNHNKLHHAFLFTGTHGVGKTSFARIFAKCLNCETGITATPCEKCSACIEINAGRFPDLYEIDAASRTKVEDTRELLSNIPYSPTQGRFKVYLIDEVHMLSGHSFNALLKTLEEPPEHVKFLLATTDPQKLPATVLSRCLQFHLLKLTVEQIESQLTTILIAEKIKFEQSALILLSIAAEGSMRDALSLLDQCIAYCNSNITEKDTIIMLGLSNKTEMLELLSAIINTNAEAALLIIKNWSKNGVNFVSALLQLITLLHKITVQQFVPSAYIEHKNVAEALSQEDVQLYYQIALMGQKDLLLAPTAQMGFEMIVLRMMAFMPKAPQIVQNPSAPHTFQNPSASEGENNWNTLLHHLSLTGPALSLAQQCSLKSTSENTYELSLHPRYKALLNPTQKQKIEAALNQYLNKAMKLMITIEETSAETPATSAKRLQEAKTASAKMAISTDPSVQTIVKNFDATIVDNSVEPLTH